MEQESWSTKQAQVAEEKCSVTSSEDVGSIISWAIKEDFKMQVPFILSLRRAGGRTSGVGEPSKRQEVGSHGVFG